MSEKEIQDKIFKILYEHTGIMSDGIKTTDDLRQIIDSADIEAFARDIASKCKPNYMFYLFNDRAFRELNPLTIDAIVKEVIEQEKRGPKYKTTFKVSAITDIKPGPNSHKEIMEMVSKRRPYRLSDFKKQYFIPNLDDKSR